MFGISITDARKGSAVARYRTIDAQDDILHRTRPLGRWGGANVPMYEVMDTVN